MGRPELGRRWEIAQRLIRENGVTYNVHGDEQGRDRPWELDALPLLIPAGEWAALAGGSGAAGAAAEHDPGRSLRPANAAGLGRFAGRVCLRPSEFSAPLPSGARPRDTYLHLYAVHLARSADDGRWLVLADRTQTPSGAGYAVENRIVISRMLPDKFQHCRVQRLASFFMSLRETLRELAAASSRQSADRADEPRPEERDLFRRRLSGPLSRLHAGRRGRSDRARQPCVSEDARRTDPDRRDSAAQFADDDCDPLELPGDSGVSGLLQAVRSGNAIVANALGSGLLEASALLSFLPQLCRRLLGEDLLIPSVATWWCGRPDDLAYVLNNFDQLAIKPAFGGVTAQPMLTSELSPAERDKLIAKIKARPRDYRRPAMGQPLDRAGA